MSTAAGDPYNWWQLPYNPPNFPIYVPMPSYGSGGPRPVEPISEDRIREIIREELREALKELNK